MSLLCHLHKSCERVLHVLNVNALFFSYFAKKNWRYIFCKYKRWSLINYKNNFTPFYIDIVYINLLWSSNLPINNNVTPVWLLLHQPCSYHQPFKTERTKTFIPVLTVDEERTVVCVLASPHSVPLFHLTIIMTVSESFSNQLWRYDDVLV